MPSTAAIVEHLLPRVRGDARGMMRLVDMIRASGDDAGAVALCHEAMALAPSDPEVQSLGRAFLAFGVPHWHAHLIQDAPRTLAYEAALKRAIKPGMRVLEIGTGTGVLAMMAARAGAGHVYTCELNPSVARAATDVVAANGFADRVTVIGKHSGQIDAEADLGGRADLLVSEIVSNDVLSEDVLPSHEDAIPRLLVPGAPVIPLAASAMVALAEHDRIERRALGQAFGFDFSAFNHLERPNFRVPVEDPRLQVRSDGAVLFGFDLSSGRYTGADRTSIELVAHGGRVNGIVQWLSLKMDSEATHDVAPGSLDYSSWAMMFHGFAKPIDTVPGQRITVHGTHNRSRLTIWAD